MRFTSDPRAVAAIRRRGRNLRDLVRHRRRQPRGALVADRSRTMAQGRPGGVPSRARTVSGRPDAPGVAGNARRTTTQARAPRAPHDPRGGARHCVKTVPCERLLSRTLSVATDYPPPTLFLAQNSTRNGRTGGAIAGKMRRQGCASGCAVTNDLSAGRERPTGKPSEFEPSECCIGRSPRRSMRGWAVVRLARFDDPYVTCLRLPNTLRAWEFCTALRRATRALSQGHRLPLGRPSLHPAPAAL